MKTRSPLIKKSSLEYFQINSFAEDNGYQDIYKFLNKYANIFNKINIYPKITYFSLYKMQKLYPMLEIKNLEYKVNTSYSTGISADEIRKIYNSIDNSEFTYSWISGSHVSDEILKGCSSLFSEHYGQWSQLGPRPGMKIRLSPKQIKRYTQGDNYWIAMAKKQNEIIAYAICQRFELKEGIISLITQLVVHEDYRNQGIATRILQSIWGFSDHFAWGLATASPYAIRALEKATRRYIDTQFIQNNLDIIKRLSENIHYYKGKTIEVDLHKSIINTEYFVDHSEIEAQIKKITQDRNWNLGYLQEGEEWLAITFKEQKAIPLTVQENRIIFSTSDATVRYAYERMDINEKHVWSRHTKHEVDFIIKEFKLPKNAKILDLGCGLGRHSIALASNGFLVTCVDFVAKNIENIQKKKKELGLLNLEVIYADARTLSLDQKFDYCICLYDVIGSFANDFENVFILHTIYKHLVSNGRVLISTMNFEISKNKAIHKNSVLKNPDVLLNLPSSKVMENTGNIFDPRYYFFDEIREFL